MRKQNRRLRGKYNRGCVGGGFWTWYEYFKFRKSGSENVCREGSSRNMRNRLAFHKFSIIVYVHVSYVFKI